MGLQISSANESNTTVELQWTDDTPGITYYKVCYGCHVVYGFGENMAGIYANMDVLIMLNCAMHILETIAFP